MPIGYFMIENLILFCRDAAYLLQRYDFVFTRKKEMEFFFSCVMLNLLNRQFLDKGLGETFHIDFQAGGAWCGCGLQTDETLAEIGGKLGGAP